MDPKINEKIQLFLDNQSLTSIDYFKQIYSCFDLIKNLEQPLLVQFKNILQLSNLNLTFKN